MKIIQEIKLKTILFEKKESMLTTSSYDSISNTKYKGMKFKKHQIGLGNNINSVVDIESSVD